MKKLVLLTSLIVLGCGAAFADTEPYASAETPATLTTQDMTSPEFLRNQGYSDEVSRITEIRAKKNQLTPIPVVEKRQNAFVRGMKKVGMRFMDTLDPTIDNKNFGEHSIRYDGVTVDDL